MSRSSPVVGSCSVSQCIYSRKFPTTSRSGCSAQTRRCMYPLWTRTSGHSRFISSEDRLEWTWLSCRRAAPRFSVRVRPPRVPMPPHVLQRPMVPPLPPQVGHGFATLVTSQSGVEFKHDLTRYRSCKGVDGKVIKERHYFPLRYLIKATNYAVTSVL
jgi:hypothetical protein